MTVQLNNHLTLSGQQGAALIVCLVLIVIITLISVTGLDNASMQQKMAANSQQHNETFQAAESSIDNAISQINGTSSVTNQDGDLVNAVSDNEELHTALKGKANIPGDQHQISSVPSELSKKNHMDVSTTYQYLSEVTNPYGYSLDADENSTTIPGHRFIITGQATINASGATTTIEQGIEYK